MSGIKKYFATPNLQGKLNELMETNDQEVSLRLHSKRSRKLKVKQTPLNEHSTYAPTDSIRLIDEQGSALKSSKDVSKKEIKTAKRKSNETKKRSTNASTSKSPQSEVENNEDGIDSAKSNIMDDCKGTNAFQVMMDARNKSIGTNSPGKEREESEILKDQNKDVIAKRRIKFEAWAAEKGGLKRKMTEEIIDEHIKHEMDKRTKRLKKLLQNNSEEKRSNSKQSLCSENKAIQIAGNDVDEKHVKKRRQIRKRANSSKAHLENVGTSSRKSNECKDNRTEANDNKIVSPNLRAKNVNSVYLNTEKEIIALSEDDKSNDAFLAKLSSPMKKNGSLLCYFGKIKSNEDENSLNEESATVNVETNITDIEMSGILKTPKSKAKLSTPGSKWKIRLVSSSLECDTNSNSTCIDLSDSLSETDMSDYHSKSTHESKTAENNNANDTKYSKARKLAPLFEKAEKNIPNAKEVKAKEEFLKSGVPEKFRLMLEKQNSYGKISFPAFPSISHIQQSSDSYIWHLPKESLDFLHFTNNMDNESINLRSNLSYLRLGTFTQCNRLQCNNEELQFNTNTYFPAERFGKYKHVLKHIKSGYPEFPVYKTFRILRDKNLSQNKLSMHNENIESNALTHNSKSKKSKRPRKLKNEKENNEDTISECRKNAKNSFLWSDAFCPSNSDEFIGNSSAINTLKDWLIQWKEFNVMKHKNSNYDSDCSYNSDADFSESNDSFSNRANFKALRNTAVLIGPVGSGKTSTIYLLANELGYNVIELNASSKRTGKIAFTKLQEATQSHRVRSKDNISSHISESAVKLSDTKKRKIKTSLGYQLLSTLKTKNSDETVPERNGSSRALSLILVEDIDIVFDQDDGFISALSQIVQTSKRPIVFTSCDENNLNVQKFMSNLVIKFKPANSRIMATWLQILCLVNNLYIDNGCILQLLDMYNGDMRKTVLQLQFWVLSGGDPHALPSKHCDSENKETVSDETIELYPDENLNLSGSEEKLLDKEEYICHKKCLLCTCTLKNTEACEHLFTLGYLWFDLSITKIHSKFEAEKFPNKKKHNQPLLSCMAEFFDTTSYIDVMLTSIQMVKEKEMHSNFHIQHVKDYLLKKSYSRSAVDPHLHHKSKEDYSRFQQDIHHSVNVFSSATNERIRNISKPLCHSPEYPKMSKALALDYTPTLRTICRAEKQRSETNMKRITSNRFYHYLKTLDVHFTDDILNFACSSLR